MKRFAFIFPAAVAGALLTAAPAFAVDPTPEPSPSSSPAPTTDVSNAGIWEAANSFVIGIEDTVLSAWPSTPENMRLGHVLDLAHEQLPLAPWYLVASAVAYGVAFLGIIAVVKAWKLIWP